MARGMQVLARVSAAGPLRSRLIIQRVKRRGTHARLCRAEHLRCSPGHSACICGLYAARWNYNLPEQEVSGVAISVLGSRITNCNAHSAVMVRGDFDGDGLPDFAVEIVYLSDLVLFVRLGNGRDQLLSQSPLPASGPGVDQALNVLPKGERISDGPVYPHDAVVSLDCSGPATVTYFTVRAGKWHSDLQITE